MIKELSIRLLCIVAPFAIFYVLYIVTRLSGYLDPMLVKDFRSGDQLTFSTIKNSPNYDLDISFKYPAHWDFKIVDEVSDNPTELTLESSYGGRTRILHIIAFEMPEEILTFTKEEQRYLVHLDSWINGRIADSKYSKILSAEKLYFANTPVAFFSSKIESKAIDFNVEFYHVNKLYAFIMLVFPPDGKSETYGFETEKQLFKTICKTLKIQNAK